MLIQNEAHCSDHSDSAYHDRLLQTIINSCCQPVVSDLVLWCDRMQSKRFASENSAEADMGLVDVDDAGLEHSHSIIQWLSTVSIVFYHSHTHTNTPFSLTQKISLYSDWHNRNHTGL